MSIPNSHHEQESRKIRNQKDRNRKAQEKGKQEGKKV
jgi:hypothetical protein